MKIALLGYGKMGKAIEQIAIDKGHTIVLKSEDDTYTIQELGLADVAIEI